MKPSLSVIIPAYNEADNLKSAFESTCRALTKAGISDYEVLIITNTRQDGTHDGTPDIADKIVSENSRVKHLFINSFKNLGYKFRQGARAAQKDFVTWVPGDNETVENSISEIFSYIGEAEMIISYTSNKHVRTWKRRFVSGCFTLLCNVLFGLNLKYYNGVCIFPRKVLQTVPMKSDNFAYMAEIIVFLVKSGVGYKQVPMEIKPTTSSSSFKLRSVFEALATIGKLFWKIQVNRIRVKLI